MYLVINKCVTAVKVSNFSGHFLHNRSTLDIGVLGYIGIVQHKEHSPKVLHIPPGTPCMFNMLPCIGWKGWRFLYTFFHAEVSLRAQGDLDWRGFGNASLSPLLHVQVVPCWIMFKAWSSSSTTCWSLLINYSSYFGGSWCMSWPEIVSDG